MTVAPTSWGSIGDRHRARVTAYDVGHGERLARAGRGLASAPSAVPAAQHEPVDERGAPRRPGRGEVARASASVSARSSSRLAASGTWVSSSAVVAGSSGSRVVARSASSRCQRTSEATTSASRSVKPIRVTILRATGSPATEWSCSEPLPMSCSSAATSSRSGRRTRADQGAGLGAGLHDVAVDGEAVDRRGVRQQPDLLPLGQERLDPVDLVEGLPHRAAGRGRWRAAARARRGRRRATARAARRPRGPAGRRWSGRARRRGSAASAAARSSRVGSSPGLVPASRTTSPRERAMPGRDALEGRRTTSLLPRGARGHRVRTPPRQARQVGDPAPEGAHVALGGLGVGEVEALGERPPHLGRDPVARAARRGPAPRRGRRAASAGPPRAPGWRRRRASWPRSP